MREVQALDNSFSKKVAAASAALCNKISFYSYFQPSIFVLAFDSREAEIISRSWKNLHLHRTVELELFSDPRKAYRVLLDRHEGAEIYAAALDARSPVSEVIQYLRLFEAAFGLPHQKLKKSLAKFLQSSGVLYKGGEIEQWVAARHAAGHADRKVSQSLRIDCIKILPRLRQAAFDVMTNKREWRNPNPSRRKGCDMINMTFEGNFHSLQGVPIVAKPMKYDPFGFLEVWHGDVVAPVWEEVLYETEQRMESKAAVIAHDGLAMTREEFLGMDWIKNETCTENHFKFEMKRQQA